MSNPIQLYIECCEHSQHAEKLALQSKLPYNDAKEIGQKAARDKWNAWAIPLLNEKISNNFEIKPREDECREKWLARQTPAVREWIDKACVDFSGMVFVDADFSEYVFPGDTIFANAKFSGNTTFRDTDFHNLADFSQSTFYGEASFKTSRFHGVADFTRVTFLEDTVFAEAQFYSTLEFDESIFVKDSSFKDVVFHSKAAFVDARFHESAIFTGARFHGWASFEEASFLGFAVFRDARFLAEPDFTAMLGKRGFNLTGTTFHVLPNFTQAHFLEAPKLDDIVLVTPIAQRISIWFKKKIPLCFKFDNYIVKCIRENRIVKHVREKRKHSQSMIAKYRALKRLALQNQDYELERKIFQSELCRARKVKKFREVLGWKYIFNVLYYFSSNYGGAVYIPVIWLALIFSASTLFYVVHHLETAPYNQQQRDAFFAGRVSAISRMYGVGKYYFGVWWWKEAPVSIAVLQESHKSTRRTKRRRGAPNKRRERQAAPAPLSIKCVTGDSTVLGAAMNVALANSTGGFLGGGHQEKLKQSYVCLYGLHTKLNDLHTQELVPRIPGVVMVVGAAQTVVSLPLLFLLLLALRSHFRISA